MFRPTVHVLRAGLTSYQQGLNLQNHLISRYNEKAEHEFRNVIILTEHKPVYTIGIQTKNYTTDDEIRLRNLGADFFRTNRGGLITFHGPGQLVAYPLLDLRQFKYTVRQYVRRLEQIIVSVCDDVGLAAKTTEDTGIWIGDEKVCALGIHVKRHITSHGIALNCNIDLTWFDHVVPCGLSGKSVTSLSAQLKRQFDIESATPPLLQNFARTFNCTIKECSKTETSNYLDQLNVS